MRVPPALDDVSLLKGQPNVWKLEVYVLLLIADVLSPSSPSVTTSRPGHKGLSVLCIPVNIHSPKSSERRRTLMIRSCFSVFFFSGKDVHLRPPKIQTFQLPDTLTPKLFLFLLFFSFHRALHTTQLQEVGRLLQPAGAVQEVRRERAGISVQKFPHLLGPLSAGGLQQSQSLQPRVSCSHSWFGFSI